MTVIGKGVGCIVSKVGSNTADGKVHLCKLEGGLGVFLTVDRHHTTVSVMALDKLH